MLDDLDEAMAKAFQAVIDRISEAGAATAVIDLSLPELLEPVVNAKGGLTRALVALPSVTSCATPTRLTRGDSSRMLRASEQLGRRHPPRLVRARADIQARVTAKLRPSTRR
ncbi:MAG: hypothetical protein ACMVO3_00030 [Thalassobaculum sp.]